MNLLQCGQKMAESKYKGFEAQVLNTVVAFWHNEKTVGLLFILLTASEFRVLLQVSMSQINFNYYINLVKYCFIQDPLLLIHLLFQKILSWQKIVG